MLKRRKNGFFCCLRPHGRSGLKSACGVDAPHRRDRVAIVAWHNDGKPNGRKPLVAIPREDERKNAKPCGVCYDVAHPEGKGIGGLSVQCRESRQANTDALRRGKIVDNSYSRRFGRHIWREQFAQPKDGCWWPIEPDVGRVAHGIPHRVDRLRCLGNAVVPAQFYPIFKGIAELFGREVQK